VERRVDERERCYIESNRGGHLVKEKTFQPNWWVHWDLKKRTGETGGGYSAGRPIKGEGVKTRFRRGKIH